MKKPILIQLHICIDDSYKERYMIVVEATEGERPLVHLVPVPQWLVFYSEEYKFYCMNFN